MPKGPQGQKRPADAIGLAVMVGAVFERSHVGLAKWMLAFRLMASAKKGVPAHLLHRTLGVTYKTAWFMAHRIRETTRLDAPEPMGGKAKIIEAEEKRLVYRPVGEGANA